MEVSARSGTEEHVAFQSAPVHFWRKPIDLPEETDAVKVDEPPPPPPLSEHSYDMHVPSAATGGAHKEELTPAETRTLWYLRGATAGFLLLTCIAAALSIYFYLRSNQEALFEERFHDTSVKVLAAIGATLEHTLGAVDVLSVALTTQAGNSSDISGSTWPFVTLDDYAVLGAKVRSLSHIFLLATYHYVTHQDRLPWEEYTRTHDQWVDQGIQTQKTDPSFRGNIVEEWESLGVINFDGLPAANASFYVPRWQSSPIVPRWDPYNWNPYQHLYLKDAIETALDYRSVVISGTFNIFDAHGPTEDDTGVVNLQDFIGDQMFAYEPAVELYVPVVQTPPGVVSWQNETSSSDSAQVVALLSASIFWRDLITNVLPLGNNGLLVVFSNTCQQSFTYELFGPQAVYLGKGDKHEGTYGDKTMSAELSDLLMQTNATYTGPLFHHPYCPYRVTLYPSQDMADEYLTRDPLLFSMVAVLIFAVTTTIFLIYDCMVERRQRKVVWTAKQSSAIVSSLFPSTLRSCQVPQKKPRQDKSSTATTATTSSTKTQQEVLLDRLVQSSDANSSAQEHPMADSFPQTSILFADLEGFSKWCSGRNPTQVFVLLERLYGAFDVLAERRGMYKVESIGDHYVAVCGIPEQRDDHALVATKFAAELRTKVQVLLKQKLGDAHPFRLRIGIHAGPVTAGILRGQRTKSFKLLFGDTVDKATCMMKTGRGNHIQASKELAELLIAAGKEHWLEKRESQDAIPSYWVEPRTMVESQVGNGGVSSVDCM